MRRWPILFFLPAMASAQSIPPGEFPPGAVQLSAEALQASLAGKVFSAKVADGSTWRLEYKANGYAFIDTSSGFRDTGKWRAEASRVCADFHKIAAACNEVRQKDDLLYLKRNSGEIVALVAR